MPDDKIEIENVNTPGRTERVDRAKNVAMRDALLAVLPSEAPGLKVADAKRRCCLAFRTSSFHKARRRDGG